MNFPEIFVWEHGELEEFLDMIYQGTLFAGHMLRNL
jgi:hypothetical protein